jgi:hypothetical protein
VLGNHRKPNERLYKRFNMNGQQYYRYQKSNVRFFVLDSNYMTPQQLAWLEKELQNSGSDWKICYFHYPLYSSGATHDSSAEPRLVLKPLFVRHGVQAVFAGVELPFQTASRTGRTGDSRMIRRVVTVSGVASGPVEVIGTPIALSRDRR